VKFTFLGTGTSQGVPVIACSCAVCKSGDARDNRLRSSLLVEAEDGWTAVIDTGPDFRQQMLREGTRRLDAVLFTHHHKDHIAGLDDVRAFNFSQGRPMEIYGSAATLQALRHEFSYAFAEEKYPGVPNLLLNELIHEPFELAGRPIIPIPVMHHRMPVLGFRFGDFAYITDANFIPDSSMKLLEGLDVLVLNALRKEPHISHFTLQQALDLVKVLQPKQAYFTHISHLLGQHEEIETSLPGGVALAYDGLCVHCK
jgi:phosphoribosyl 1,2-cyclic phosphate phosphodiesterase